jgi:hypothetical protein
VEHSLLQCHHKVAVLEITQCKLEDRDNLHKDATNSKDIILWIYLMNSMDICKEMKLLLVKRLKKKDKIILELQDKLNKIRVAL